MPPSHRPLAPQLTGRLTRDLSDLHSLTVMCLTLASLGVGCGGATDQEAADSADVLTTSMVFQATPGMADTSAPSLPDVVEWFPDAEEPEYGWVVPPDSSDEGETVSLPTCGDETVAVPPPAQPASVLLTLDRSGSMSSNGKWEMAVSALGDVLDVVGPSFHFGLLLYPQEAHSCTLTPEPHVAFGLSQGPHIVDTMTTLGTSHGTPTGGALEAALGIFEAQAPTATRVLIITTDGQPNCLSECTGCEAYVDGWCTDGDCDACMHESRCVEYKVLEGVSALADAGVSTYVIGLPGSEGAADLLDEMAVLGGTALDGPVKHYDITSGGSLGEALLAITDSLGNCSVTLEPPPGYAFLTVQLNGEAIPQDPQGIEGWSMSDPETLQFHGDACTIASAEDAEVTVTYICKYAE